MRLISFLILINLSACDYTSSPELKYIILLSPYSCAACSPIYLQDIQYLIETDVPIRVVMPKVRDKELKKYFGEDLYLKIKPNLMIGDDKYIQFRETIDNKHAQDEINYLLVSDHNEDIISYYPLKYVSEENLIAIIKKSQIPKL